MKYAGLAFAALTLFMLMASVPEASARVCGAAVGPNGAVAGCTHRGYHRAYHRARHSTTVIHRRVVR
jgi:hypothetical protein